MHWSIVQPTLKKWHANTGFMGYHIWKTVQSSHPAVASTRCWTDASAGRSGRYTAKVSTTPKWFDPRSRNGFVNTGLPVSLARKMFSRSSYMRNKWIIYTKAKLNWQDSVSPALNELRINKRKKPSCNKKSHLPRHHVHACKVGDRILGENHRGILILERCSVSIHSPHNPSMLSFKRFLLMREESLCVSHPI